LCSGARRASLSRRGIAGCKRIWHLRITQLSKNIDDFSQLVSQRQQRVYQVQSEIIAETARSPLNPAALGIRYTEVETICRNVRDEAVATQNRNLSLLTEAQKLKLKTLEDASTLMPIINEARIAGMLAPGPSITMASKWFDTTSFVNPILPGCQIIVFGRLSNP
jgi:hypothetical protein